MRLTIGRWLSAFACSAAIVVVVLQAWATHLTPQPWDGMFSGVAPIVELTTDARYGAFAAARHEHLDRSVLEGWDAARLRAPSSALVVDATFPDSVRDAYIHALTPFTSASASDSLGARVAIYVHRDTTALEAWATRTDGRKQRLATTFDRFMISPSRSQDGRCVAVLSVGVATMKPEKLGNPLGPCTAVARLGRPGHAVAALLDTLGWKPPHAFRYESDPSASRMHRRADARAALSLSGMLCLTSGKGCDALWTKATSDRWNRRTTDDELLHLSIVGVSGYDREALELDAWLSTIGNEIGNDALQNVWTSDRPLSESIAERTQLSRGEWTHRWLSSLFAPVVTSPLPSSAELMWAVLTCAVLAATAIRARTPRAR